MKARPVRVCFPFVGDRIGGSHISALLLIENIDRRRFEPIVVLHRCDGELAGLLESKGIAFKILSLPVLVGGKRNAFLEDVFALLKNFVPLFRFLRQHKIRIVHTQDLRMHLTWSIAASLSGVAFVWHQRSRIKAERKHRVIRLALASASRILCISQFVARHLDEKRWMDKLSVVDNPFDTSAPKPNKNDAKARLRNELGLPLGIRIVGSVANLRPQKRATLFIDSAARLHEKGSGSIAFVLFGTIYGDHVREIEARLRRHDLHKHVHLLGFKAPIEDYIAGCDLLLCPAIEEGFGRTLVEAMSVDTPVIAVDSGGHSEILRHEFNGLLVPANDAPAMAQAAERLLAEPATASRLARDAFAYVQQTYSIDRHVTAIMEVYDQLLSPNRSLVSPAGITAADRG